MYKEMFVVLCLTAVVLVQAYPSEGVEAQKQAAVAQAELEPSNAEDSDLEGAESRSGRFFGGYGGGWGGRRYGGWGGRGYGGYGGGYGGYGGYGGGYGGYGGYGGGWNRGWNYYG